MAREPYWLVNVPQGKWPNECPEFLINANAKDRGILSTLDADYKRQTWPEVQQIIKSNRIDRFQRVPSDLRRYLGYNAKLKKEYGSVMNFVLTERLQWKDLTPSPSVSFTEPSDVKILYNDWPYGVDQKIVHLVIWTKFDLEDDPLMDDLTPRVRKEIDDYVDKTFCKRVRPDNVWLAHSSYVGVLMFKKVIWFKNWRSLKSVHAVEHFHIMLYDPDPDFVREITNGDVPLSAKVA
ncbi:hypothetical protein MMC30_001877 [Trapelia coarctata]|nr:hypothetical protein [Trapelia coarctata]